MGRSPSAERRRLLASLGAGLLLAIGALTWTASTPRNSPMPFGRECALSGTTPTPGESQPAVPLTLTLESALPATRAELPETDGRKPPVDETLAHPWIEILVRAEEDAAPMPDCEVLYIDAGGPDEYELAGILSRRGLDMGEIRRVSSHARTDEKGRVHLPYRAERIYAMALSETRAGMRSFETAAAGDERVIECSPVHFLRAQVVDGQGRPQRGVPVCVTRRSAGLSNIDAISTTRGADAIAEFGPIEADETELLLLRLAGAFDGVAPVEVDPKSWPQQPIRLVLPAHGSLEVRIVGANGRNFAGDAEVELAPYGGTDPSAPAPTELVGIRSGAALFQPVGLGLELEARVSVPGRDLPIVVRGPGPRVAGEKAVLEARLGDSSLTLVARLLDSELRPLRFREIHFLGAVVSSGSALKIYQQVLSDGVGNVALNLEAIDSQQSRATLLIVREDGPHSLGTLNTVVIRRGNNELGPLLLEPARLLAAGRVVDARGVAMPMGVDVELFIRDPRREIGWSAPAKTDEEGRFELRGWSSETTISLLTGSPGPTQTEPLAVAKGSTDLVIVGPALKD